MFIRGISFLTGLFLMITGFKTARLTWIVLGLFILVVVVSIQQSIDDNKEIQEASIDRSESIIDKIGGVNNIDINLSKYGYNSQLIILKDKSILIGYNNFETEKIISFSSIVNVEVRINHGKIESGGEYNRYSRDIIESIVVYIHTNECTEELIFRYSCYRDNNAQEKYNEILKGLKRFKTILGDTHDTDDLDSEININYKEKYIPEQIKEYKELLDIGAITEEEYEIKKKELLSK